MTKRSTLSLYAIMAAALLLGAQCKKGGETGGTTTGEAPAPAPADTGTAAPESGEVTTYPNMVPQGGTVRLLQPFVIHTAADPNSKILPGCCSVGTLVDLKNSYGNWMMIMWPSGVGQLSPGWIELRSVNDNRVTVVQRDAGKDAAIVDASIDVGVPVVDAAPPPVVDAGVPSTVGDGGRRTLKIPPRKTGN
jgi:hypothetical protein